MLKLCKQASRGLRSARKHVAQAVHLSSMISNVSPPECTLSSTTPHSFLEPQAALQCQVSTEQHKDKMTHVL